MNVSVSDAQISLVDLVRRAEAGDEVILTRDGQPAARIVSIAPEVTAKTIDRAARRALLLEIWEEARARRLAGDFDGEEAARSQDFLYDEDGLPG